MANIVIPHTWVPLEVPTAANFNAINNEIATKFNTYAVQTDVAKTITVSHTQAADMLFSDALYDIGKAGATRPRDGFFYRNLSVGNNLQVGALLDLTATGQISFPAVQIASAGANTLDDYEEGTFIAGLAPGTSGTITLNAAFNTLGYTKVGRLVTVTGTLVVSAVAAPVGSLTLTGLPFVVGSGNDKYAVAAIRINLAAGTLTGMNARTSPTTSTLVIDTRLAAGAWSSNAADIVAGTEIALSFSYLTNT